MKLTRRSSRSRVGKGHLGVVDADHATTDPHKSGRVDPISATQLQHGLVSGPRMDVGQQRLEPWIDTHVQSVVCARSTSTPGSSGTGASSTVRVLIVVDLVRMTLPTTLRATASVRFHIVVGVRSTLTTILPRACSSSR